MSSKEREPFSRKAITWLGGGYMVRPLLFDRAGVEDRGSFR